MLRLPQIAKLLNISGQKVTNDLLVKGKGRYFLVYQSQFYAFPSTKEVIIPFDMMENYAKLIHQKKVEKPLMLEDLQSPIVNTPSRRSYHSAVLLGHFNHGKTTLLDTLINYTESNQTSDLVSQEKHRITQVLLYPSIISLIIYLDVGSKNKID